MTYLMIYRYAFGDLTSDPVISEPEELLALDIDDNHCTGNDLFEIYGKSAKILILRDLNIYDGFVIPGFDYNRPEIYDYSFNPPVRIFSDYLNYIFQIKKNDYAEDGSLLSSKNLFTGLARVDSIIDNEEQNEVEFTIYDLLWVWIYRAKAWSVSPPFNRTLNMGIIDNSGFTSLAEMVNRVVDPLGDFKQISFDFDLNSAIYFENKPYVIPGYENDFDTWTYKRIFYGGTHTYSLVTSWIRIDSHFGSYENPTPDPTKIKVVMCKLYREVISGTINVYYYAVRYIRFEIPLNSKTMPVNVEIGSIDMTEMTADYLPAVINWIHDTYLYPGYGVIAGGQMTFIGNHEHIITETPLQKVMWDGTDFRYWALGSYETMVLLAGKHMMTDVIKGMLALNNLTIYVDRDGVMRIINRLNYWENTEPIISLSDSDLIQYQNKGTIIDITRVLDSIDIFEGAESTKDALLDFYRLYTDKFCSVVSFKLAPEYYASLLDISHTNNLMLLPLQIQGRKYFLTKYSEVQDNELMNCECIGNYSGSAPSTPIVAETPGPFEIESGIDYTDWHSAYSLRRLRHSFTGNVIIIVADETETPEYGIGFDEDGELDTAAITAAIASAGNPGIMRIKKWYNQAYDADDNPDVEQWIIQPTTTNSLRPKIVVDNAIVEDSLGNPAALFYATSGAMPTMKANTNWHLRMRQNYGLFMVSSMIQTEAISDTNKNTFGYGGLDLQGTNYSLNAPCLFNQTDDAEADCRTQHRTKSASNVWDQDEILPNAGISVHQNTGTFTYYDATQGYKLSRQNGNEASQNLALTDYSKEPSIITGTPEYWFKIESRGMYFNEGIAVKRAVTEDETANAEINMIRYWGIA